MNKMLLKPLTAEEQKQVSGGGSWPVWPGTEFGQCPNPALKPN